MTGLPPSQSQSHPPKPPPSKRKQKQNRRRKAKQSHNKNNNHSKEGGGGRGNNHPPLGGKNRNKNWRKNRRRPKHNKKQKRVVVPYRRKHSGRKVVIRSLPVDFTRENFVEEFIGPEFSTTIDSLLYFVQGQSNKTGVRYTNTIVNEVGGRGYLVFPSLAKAHLFMEKVKSRQFSYFQSKVVHEVKKKSEEGEEEELQLEKGDEHDDTNSRGNNNVRVDFQPDVMLAPFSQSFESTTSRSEAAVENTIEDDPAFVSFLERLKGETKGNIGSASGNGEGGTGNEMGNGIVDKDKSDSNYSTSTALLQDENSEVKAKSKSSTLVQFLVDKRRREVEEKNNRRREKRSRDRGKDKKGKKGKGIIGILKHSSNSALKRAAELAKRQNGKANKNSGKEKKQRKKKSRSRKKKKEESSLSSKSTKVSVDSQKESQLISMGFSKSDAVDALLSTKGDLQSATELLMAAPKAVQKTKSPTKKENNFASILMKPIVKTMAVDDDL
eukprot:g3270.t1